jgi:hypothetical protein
MSKVNMIYNPGGFCHIVAWERRKAHRVQSEYTVCGVRFRSRDKRLRWQWGKVKKQDPERRVPGRPACLKCRFGVGIHGLLSPGASAVGPAVHALLRANRQYPVPNV